MAKRRLSFPELLMSILTVLTLTKARHISMPPSPSTPLAPRPEFDPIKHLSPQYFPLSPEAADAPVKDQYENLSPQNPPASSPSSSPQAQTKYFPSDYYSPPSFSPQDKPQPPSTSTSTETGGYDDGADDDLWPQQQHPSPQIESSYTGGDDDEGKNEYRHDLQNEKPTAKEENRLGDDHSGGAVFGLVMGVCVVGLGGFVCMKRRENDMRRRAKYVSLARREIF